MSRRHWLRGIRVTAAALWVLPACGGDDDDDDGVSLVDSGPGGSTGEDGSAGGCPVDESLGALGPISMAQAQHFAQPAAPGQAQDPAIRYLTVGANVSGGAQPFDLLYIELWDNFGTFGGGQLAAGDFPIEGSETSAALCGVCVYVLGDAQEVGGSFQFATRYAATGGSVSIESAGTRAGNDITGNYTGSATGLTLVEINEQGTPIAGGCETAVDSVSWDAPITSGDDPAAARAIGRAPAELTAPPRSAAASPLARQRSSRRARR